VNGREGSLYIDLSQAQPASYAVPPVSLPPASPQPSPNFKEL